MRYDYRVSIGDVKICFASLVIALISSCDREAITRKEIGRISLLKGEVYSFSVALPHPKYNVWEIGLGLAGDIPERVLTTRLGVALVNEGDEALTVNWEPQRWTINPGERAIVFEGMLEDIQRGRLMTYSEGGGRVSYNIEFDFRRSNLASIPPKLATPITIYPFQRRRDF
jgi:hypothetical protein